MSSYIDTTFERGGDLIRTLVKAYGGWDSSKTGCQFYDYELVDWRKDIRLRVAVWMNSTLVVDLESLEHNYSNAIDFPLDLTANFDDGRFKASIQNGRVTTSVLLNHGLPWIHTANGKPAVDWGPLTIAQHRGTAYWLRQMIVFNLPSASRGDYKEWDLLPFLPGGLVERNRRKH